MSTPPSPVRPVTIERLKASVPQALALLAGMQLGVFDRLAGGARSATDLAGAMGVAEDRLSRLLYALAVTGLLERQGGLFRNSEEAAAFLVRGQPGDMGSSHELLSQLWLADACTARSIRSGAPAALHDFETASDDDMAAMLRGMHPTAVAAGRDLASRFDFSGCLTVVDIGGGSGGLIAALCDALPHLAGTLFELPRNARLAGPILGTSADAPRVTIQAGDILAAPPEERFDAAVMRALVQVLPAEAAARAIGHAAEAVRPSGHLYILGGGILDDDRMGPAAAVFLNVTFMNLYAGGASYTESEHAAWLTAAGCDAIERVILPSGGSVIRARKRPV